MVVVSGSIPEISILYRVDKEYEAMSLRYREEYQRYAERQQEKTKEKLMKLDYVIRNTLELN